MKNTLFAAIISLLLFGCLKENSEDSRTTTLTVITYNAVGTYTSDSIPISVSKIYIYNDLNFGYDYATGVKYTLESSGVLKSNKGTSIAPSSTIIPTSFITTATLKNGTYGIVADASNISSLTDSQKWSGVSIKLPENISGYKSNNKITFVFR